MAAHWSIAQIDNHESLIQSVTQLPMWVYILFLQASRGTSACPLLFMTILVPFLLIKITAASVSVSYEYIQNLVG